MCLTQLYKDQLEKQITNLKAAQSLLVLMLQGEQGKRQALLRLDFPGASCFTVKEFACILYAVCGETKKEFDIVRAISSICYLLPIRRLLSDVISVLGWF